MRMVRFKDALLLQNERAKFSGEKPIKVKDLGPVWFPSNKKNSGQVRAAQVIREGKTFKPKQIADFCNLVGVDPNFLYGFPSFNDVDFEKIKR